MEQDMGMILYGVNQDGRGVHAFQNRNHVGMQLRPDVIGWKGFAALSTENQMNQNLG